MFGKIERNLRISSFSFGLLALTAVGAVNAAEVCGGGRVVAVSSEDTATSNGFLIVVEGLSGTQYTYHLSGSLVGNTSAAALAKVEQLYETSLLALSTGLTVHPKVIDGTCLGTNMTSMIGLKVVL